MSGPKANLTGGGAEWQDQSLGVLTPPVGMSEAQRKVPIISSHTKKLSVKDFLRLFKCLKNRFLMTLLYPLCGHSITGYIFREFSTFLPIANNE